MRTELIECKFGVETHVVLKLLGEAYGPSHFDAQNNVIFVDDRSFSAADLRTMSAVAEYVLAGFREGYRVAAEDARKYGT
jgi:hypothetical protein